MFRVECKKCGNINEFGCTYNSSESRWDESKDYEHMLCIKCGEGTDHNVTTL